MYTRTMARSRGDSQTTKFLLHLARNIEALSSQGTLKAGAAPRVAQPSAELTTQQARRVEVLWHDLRSLENGDITVASEWFALPLDQDLLLEAHGGDSEGWLEPLLAVGDSLEGWVRVL